MSDEEIYAENVRLIILRELNGQTDHQVNETIMSKVLEEFGHRKTRDYIRTQFRKLEELGAIRIRVVNSVLVAQLLRPGLEHLQRRAFLEGVGRPSLEG